MKSSSHVSLGRKFSQAPRGPDRAARSDSCEVDVVHLDAIRRARRILPGNSQLDEAVAMVALLSNATRLKMVLALQPDRSCPEPELCVCDLATVTGASKSLASHQLRLLRMAGIVQQRREGKLIFYRLADRALAQTLAGLASAAIESAPGR